MKGYLMVFIYKLIFMNNNFDKLVSTWERCFQVTQPTKKAKKIRLEELETWDKPRTQDQILEHNAKIEALKNLLQ